MQPLLKNHSVIRQEHPLSRFIPYGAHLDDYTISTLQGDYLQVIKLAGVSFQSVDDSEINTWHNRLNILLRNIASPNISLYQHIIRRRENYYPESNFQEGFAKQFNDRYAERMRSKVLMVNELYLTVIFRPQPSKITKNFFDFFKKADSLLDTQERMAAVNKLDKIIYEILSSLERYEPERLGIYQQNNMKYSHALNFLGFLINNECQSFPLPRSPINKVLATTRPFFGQESIELRAPTQTMYGAMLGIKEYPSETSPGFLNHLLTLPFEFILTQSFSFLAKEKAKTLMKLQQNRLEQSGDDAVSQIIEINDALDDLVSNRFTMGVHHLSLFVKASSITNLTDNLAAARTALADAGMVIAREDLALEAAYWAQLPANFRWRPRTAPITSRNFAASAPLHNFPIGKKSGNHWGEALMMLATAASTPYYYSCHASDPQAADGGTKKDVGHTLTIGPTGSGKTVFLMAKLCMLQKFNATSILFSKDRDSEICIRAIGGKVFPLKMGQPTGFNPFQLEPTPKNLQFLAEFVFKLMGGRSAISIYEQKEIVSAITGLMELPHSSRRLGRLREFLNITTKEGAYARLNQWCYSQEAGESDGLYAWAFDNKDDILLPTLPQTRTLGFDITQFLNHPPTCASINMYLLYLANSLADGRRLAIFISEFWKALSDPYFEGFAQDMLKTLRKKNGFVVLDSQSPSDVLNHPLSRTLIEQTPTKIIFPNPDADKKEYMEGLGLSEREFWLVKEGMTPRQILIKQGHVSVVVTLDLGGMNYVLDVMSTREANLGTVEELIGQFGDSPDKWLSRFEALRESP